VPHYLSDHTRSGPAGAVETEHVTGHNLEVRRGDGEATHELTTGKLAACAGSK